MYPIYMKFCLDCISASRLFGNYLKMKLLKTGLFRSFPSAVSDSELMLKGKKEERL